MGMVVMKLLVVCGLGMMVGVRGRVDMGIRVAGISLRYIKNVIFDLRSYTPKGSITVNCAYTR
jgi:hypothetical protein